MGSADARILVEIGDLVRLLPAGWLASERPGDPQHPLLGVQRARALHPCAYPAGCRSLALDQTRSKPPVDPLRLAGSALRNGCARGRPGGAGTDAYHLGDGT